MFDFIVSRYADLFGELMHESFLKAIPEQFRNLAAQGMSALIDNLISSVQLLYVHMHSTLFHIF